MVGLGRMLRPGFRDLDMSCRIQGLKAKEGWMGGAWVLRRRLHARFRA